VTTVHAVVPAGLDDPRRPSGGNGYDRRVCSGLSVLGWQVQEHHVSGSWPQPAATDLARLATAVATVPAGSVLLVDGLIASVACGVLDAAARRLRVVVLVHMPIGGPGEGAVLAAARAVVTTSAWARKELLRRHHLDPAAVHVAEPGAEPAPPANGTAAGGELLCVGAVTRLKGHDLLLSALAALTDLSWRCRCIGSVEVDPAYVEELTRHASTAGLADRVSFCGVRTGADLDRLYATSDLLVHPSRSETYGMVLTEALARGLPVVAADVGGTAEALGPDGARAPGRLVVAGDAAVLTAALRSWLTDTGTRAEWRAAAAFRRRTLPSWENTTHRIADVLAKAAS
jgi:glycosyltransferase involved in cell wall biosynthesis